MFIKAAALVIASLTVTEIAPADKLANTVTITKELAENLGQHSNEQQMQIENMKYEIYQYRMLLHEARTKMCA